MNRHTNCITSLKSHRTPLHHTSVSNATLGTHMYQYVGNVLKYHKRYDQGPKNHGKPRRVSLPVGEAHLDGYLKVWVGVPCVV